MTSFPASAPPATKKRGPRRQPKPSTKDKSGGPKPTKKSKEKSARTRGSHPASNGKRAQGTRHASKEEDRESLEDGQTRDLLEQKPVRAIIPYGVNGNTSHLWIRFDHSKDLADGEKEGSRAEASEAEHRQFGDVNMGLETA